MSPLSSEQPPLPPGPDSGLVKSSEPVRGGPLWPSRLEEEPYPPADVSEVPFAEPDMVNHPPHYKQVPGVECIDVVEHFGFLRGSAIKYLWRAGVKAPGTLIQDLEKARWYIDREIAKLQRQT